MKSRRKRSLGPTEPLRHPDHRRPVTRREFLGQGFLGASATVAGLSVFSLFADPRKAYATLAPDIAALKISPCNITAGSGMIPFICFDLAGGGKKMLSKLRLNDSGGRLEYLSTARS